MVRLNKRMIPDEHKDEIHWSADDPSAYSFSLTPRRRKQETGQEQAPDENVNVAATKEEQVAEQPVVHTVASYFWTKYGIRLKYPKMPIVHTSEGYYPIELLFQAQDKVFGANDSEKVKDVLAFNDGFASTARIDHLESVKAMVEQLRSTTGLDLRDLMRQFNVEVSDKPKVFKTRVLKEPMLKFGDESKVPVNNGSWNLRGAKFSR